MSVKQMLLVLSTITLSLEAALPCGPCSLTLKSNVAFSPAISNILTFSPQHCLVLSRAINANVTVYAPGTAECSVGTSTPITTGLSVSGAAFSANGSCLIIADVSNQTVTTYSVASDCTVTPVSTVPVTNLARIAVSSTGCVVATTSASGTVYTGTLGTDCSLTLTASAVTLSAVATPVFSADGSCVAFYGTGLSAVLIYPVNANCTLGTLAQTISINSSSAAFGPGNCLAISDNASSSVGIYTPDPMTPCSYILNGTLTNGITATTALLAFSSNNCLAVSNVSFGPESGSVPIYSINSDCTIANGGAPIQTLAIAQPHELAYSPDGVCLAIVDNANSRVVFYGPVVLLTPVLTTAIASGCGIGTISVSGTTSASVPVAIFVDGAPAASVVSNTSGNFSAILGPLFAGTYAITAQAQDTGSGCTSTSAVTSVTVPAAPVISSISTTCLGVSIVGTASANTPVTLFINGQARATVSTDASGTFLFFIPLTSGTYMFSVADIATGCASAILTRTIVLPSCTTLTNTNTAFGGNCNNR